MPSSDSERNCSLTTLDPQLWRLLIGSIGFLYKSHMHTHMHARREPRQQANNSLPVASYIIASSCSGTQGESAELQLINTWNTVKHTVTHFNPPSTWQSACCRCINSREKRCLSVLFGRGRQGLFLMSAGTHSYSCLLRRTLNPAWKEQRQYWDSSVSSR